MHSTSHTLPLTISPFVRYILYYWNHILHPNLYRTSVSVMLYGIIYSGHCFL